jgi:formate hydrogenlyase transcriptional activator
LKTEIKALQSQMHVVHPDTEEKALKKRRLFEEIIYGLSARFMAAPYDQIDGEINNALRLIKDFFQVDLCALLKVEEVRAFVRVSHAVYGEGIKPLPGDINLAELYPWSLSKLMRGEHININREEDYPEEALIDRQSSGAMGTISRLVIPITFRGRISRIITIHQRHRHQTWPEEYIPRLHQLGEILVNALDRRENRLELEKQLRFERLLAEISGRFVNLPAERIDSEIEDAQRRICELLDIDRSSLWRTCEAKPGTLMLTNIIQPLEHSIPGGLHGNDFFPWVAQKILGGETLVISKLTDLPPEAGRDLESFRAFGTKSTVLVPLSVGEGPVFGLLGFAVLREERHPPETTVMGFRLIAQVFANALIRKQMEEKLKERLNYIEALRQQLETENIYLREEAKLLGEHTDIVGQSFVMKRVLSQVEQVAKTDSTILLLGETGTGKELLARTIHSMSRRKDKLLVTVNCASLAPTLIESELFGREKGAYTGALTRMTGRFEIADGSTLFLDEIGELPLDLQAKLLRVLERGEFERLGSCRTIKVNVRIIAATNRDIEQELNDGRFRRDLFYRLNVFPIAIPPLRDRPEDIPLLVRSIVKEFQSKMCKEIESIPKKTMDALESYSWPGNIRELRNLIEHAMILNKGKILIVHMHKHASSKTDTSGNFNDMERKLLLTVMEKSHWRIAGHGGAAEALGLKRTTLQAKLKRLGIHRSNGQMPQ